MIFPAFNSLPRIRLRERENHLFFIFFFFLPFPERKLEFHLLLPACLIASTIYRKPWRHDEKLSNNADNTPPPPFLSPSPSLSNFFLSYTQTHYLFLSHTLKHIAIFGTTRHRRQANSTLYLFTFTPSYRGGRHKKAHPYPCRLFLQFFFFLFRTCVNTLY